MSGTSCDGVDGALVEIQGSGIDMQVRYIEHHNVPYPERVRHHLLEIMAPARTRTEDLAGLNICVGELFANCASELMKKKNLKPRDIVAIGSHGQTICHMPESEEQPATLQIGEPAIIAAQTGVCVVSDFRQNDMAVGGQGAPLVPWTDFILFKGPEVMTCVQNIGGIANVSCIPPGGGIKDVVAFDTGPGCMVVDELVRRLSKEKHQFDPQGGFAARGAADIESIKKMMQLPYFLQEPPKSAGREQFGRSFVNGMAKLMGDRKLSTYDKMATATLLTARSIAHAYNNHLKLNGQPARVVLCGGGARNVTLLRMLREELNGHKIHTIDQFGIPLEAKECVSFAILAAACLDGVPSNLPQVTGAKRAVVLGKIVRL